MRRSAPGSGCCAEWALRRPRLGRTKRVTLHLPRELGVSTRSWFNWESGNHVPGPIALRLVVYTGCRPEWLLTGEGAMFRAVGAAAYGGDAGRPQHLLRQLISYPASERGFPTTEIAEFHGKKLQDKQTPAVRLSPTHSAFPVPFSRRSLLILVVILIVLVIFFLIVIGVVIVIRLREANSSLPLRATHPSRARVSEQMSESERNAGDHTSGRTPHCRPRLMDRAMREKWAIPGSLRLPLVERLGEIVCDPKAPHREVLSADSAILTASTIYRRISR